MRQCYQRGCLRRTHRKSGPDCWEFLWREKGVTGKRVRRTIVIGTVTHFPTVDLARAAVNGLRMYGAYKVWFSMQFHDERGTVPSVRISHGLLLFLGLMVLVYSPNRPPVMLIQEPENGLTPTALKEFYKAVRELAHREDVTQRSQVLISSHSPFIICEAWNGDDREFIHQVKVENGRAVIRKFSEAIKEQGIQLQKDKSGQRTILGLRTAEELMSGYLF
jgi:hypothetical protein